MIETFKGSYKGIKHICFNDPCCIACLKEAEDKAYLSALSDVKKIIERQKQNVPEGKTITMAILRTIEAQLSALGDDKE